MDADVVVIGGGPAGATIGAILAKEGHRVHILERERFPRHHVGESLQPACFELLDLHLGLADKIAAAGFQRKFGAIYEWGKSHERWSVLFDDRLEGDLAHLTPETLRAGDYAHAWHVERSRFDALLLDEARDRGAEISQVEATGPVTEHGRVVGVELADGRTISARLVVDASGQRCTLGRRLGLVKNHTDLKSTAIYGHFKGCGGLDSALGRDATLIVSVPEGWVWFIPIADDLTSIGWVTSAGAKLDEEQFLEVIGRAHIPFGEGSLVEDEDGVRVRQVRDWSYVLSRVAGPGWMAVGDAAGFVDPILSGGTEFAIRGSCNAAITASKVLDPTGTWDGDAELVGWDQRYRDEHASYLRLARYWYGNNRSVDGFFWEARREIPKDAHSIDTPLRAFVYLTSGRYEADRHLKVFIDWQEKRIFERLGVDRKALKAAVADAKRRLHALPA